MCLTQRHHRTYPWAPIGSIKVCLQILSLSLSPSPSLSLLPPIAITMSSLRDLEVLPDRSTQSSWAAVKQALNNWAVAYDL